jgi:hypothetical protein
MALPVLVPRTFVALIPALTLSRISSRSNWATAARMCISELAPDSGIPGMPKSMPTPGVETLSTVNSTDGNRLKMHSR